MELARKRGWKGYWVCLKGTTLLFYPCDSREVAIVKQNAMSNMYCLTWEEVFVIVVAAVFERGD